MCLYTVLCQLYNFILLHFLTSAFPDGMPMRALFVTGFIDCVSRTACVVFLFLGDQTTVQIHTVFFFWLMSKLHKTVLIYINNSCYVLCRSFRKYLSSSLSMMCVFGLESCQRRYFRVYYSPEFVV